MAFSQNPYRWFFCFHTHFFSGPLISERSILLRANRVGAIQQAAIRKSRTSGNHHWPQPIRDARRATRRVSAGEVARKSGSHPSSPSFLEEHWFSSLETSAVTRAPPFRVRSIFHSHFGSD